MKDRKLAGYIDGYDSAIEDYTHDIIGLIEDAALKVHVHLKYDHKKIKLLGLKGVLEEAFVVVDEIARNVSQEMGYDEGYEKGYDDKSRGLEFKTWIDGDYNKKEIKG